MFEFLYLYNSLIYRGKFIRLKFANEHHCFFIFPEIITIMSTNKNANAPIPIDSLEMA
jgi:hypothetical protein